MSFRIAAYGTFTALGSVILLSMRWMLGFEVTVLIALALIAVFALDTGR